MRLLYVLLAASTLAAQPPGFGPGGPGMEDIKLVKRFDRNKDGWLNAEERKAARATLGPRRGPMGGPPPFMREAAQEPAKPGVKLTPQQVKHYAAEPLYDPKAVRTLFLEFENPEWQKELADFYGSDVDVPARLTVDGRSYPNVGVHFRGMTSYMMVPEGRKKSLNLSLDLVDKDQRLLGYRTLNLLNSAGDPSMLRSVLYLDIARSYGAAPKANFVRVVINGESWGIYVNAQQFNSDFTRDFYGTTEGWRWKVSGSPMGRGGLRYLGDDASAYKKIYDLKGKSDPKAWAALIALCRTLEQTPPAQLEAALAPMLDIDETLKFLAVEKALINNDGYWIRASDYSLYADPKGRFHLIPHDANETLREMEGGPGGMMGPPPGMERMERMGPPPRMMGGGGGVELDPMAGSDDPEKALLNKLLAVPAVKARYLGYVRDVAAKWLDWSRLGPLATGYRSLIAEDVKADTRKLASTDDFVRSLDQDAKQEGFRGPGAGPSLSLKSFADKRRAYLLKPAK